MDRSKNPSRRVRGTGLPKRTRATAPSVRQREFEQQLLKIKFAANEERVELLAHLAADAALNLVQRRQVLFAIQRYILSQRADAPADLQGVLFTVLKVLNSVELRIRALGLFRMALDHVRRGEVLKQIADPLRELLLQFLPKSAKAEFSPELFLRAGQQLEEAGEVEGVVDLASLGLFFYPFHGPLREMRAFHCYTLGELGEAREDYDKLIEQYPERVEYLLDRAEVELRSEAFDDALEDLTAYLVHHPDDPAAMRKQAECMYQLGRNIESHRLLSKLLAMEGERPELLVNRARVNEQLDYLEDAVADAEKALSLDAENQEAKQLRHSLLLKRQSYGMEDDVYSAFLRGDDDALIGETKVPELRFSDIGGLEKSKQLIRETIEYPLKFPELSARYGKKAGGGLLFFGPPGCGKTMLARAAAGECGVAFIDVNLATVLDKWVGNSEKAVSMIFSSARKRAPSIVFLDEVDAIGGSRASMQAGWEKKLISQLLIELDSLSSTSQQVMVLGASNAPWDVDFALRRPGRLGRLIFVPPPGPAERAEIFRIYLSRKPFVDADIDYDELARLTEHYSADSIRQIVENGASIPWRAAIQTGDAIAVNMEHLRLAITQTPADLAEWEKLVERYQDFAQHSMKRPGIGFKKNPQESAQ